MSPCRYFLSAEEIALAFNAEKNSSKGSVFDVDAQALVEVLLLPDLRGWGRVSGLRDAMLVDTTLRGLVEGFVELGASETEAANDDEGYNAKVA